MQTCKSCYLPHWLNWINRQTLSEKYYSLLNDMVTKFNKCVLRHTTPRPEALPFPPDARRKLSSDLPPTSPLPTTRPAPPPESLGQGREAPPKPSAQSHPRLSLSSLPISTRCRPHRAQAWSLPGCQKENTTSSGCSLARGRKRGEGQGIAGALRSMSFSGLRRWMSGIWQLFVSLSFTNIHQPLTSNLAQYLELITSNHRHITHQTLFKCVKYL